jgi:hypothetical protein
MLFSQSGNFIKPLITSIISIISNVYFPFDGHFKKELIELIPFEIEGILKRQNSP